MLEGSAIHMGRRPLHYAVIEDDEELAELLLERGASMYAVSRVSETILR